MPIGIWGWGPGWNPGWRPGWQPGWPGWGPGWGPGWHPGACQNGWCPRGTNNFGQGPYFGDFDMDD